MKASGPGFERETIININDEDNLCSIWTASAVVYRALIKRLGTDCLREDGERHAVFMFPSEWLILPKKKTKRVLNPDQRAKLAIQLAKAQAAQGREKIKRGI
jgi:hypothetical protein